MTYIKNLSFLDNSSNEISNNVLNDNRFILRIMISFLIIILLFILVSINNIWVYSVYFTIISLILLRDSIRNYKRKYPIFILLFTGVFIILWQFRYSIKSFFTKKKQNNSKSCESGCKNNLDTLENFYTLFRPYEPYPGTNKLNFNLSENIYLKKMDTFSRIQ